MSLDAIERLQTQISQNSGALAAHTRDIRRGEESFQQLEATLRREFAAQVQRQSMDIQRVDDAVARLHLEMQSMRQALETVSHELVINRTEIHRGIAAQPVQTAHVPDAALELMAQQLDGIAHKTTELEMLKITVEIMKNKISRLEQGTSTALAQHTRPPTLQSSQPTAPPQASTASSFHNTTPAAKASPQNQNASDSHIHQPLGAQSSTLPEAAPGQGTGWASINAGVKRTFTNGVESSHEGTPHVPGSPKRQKVGSSDAHLDFAASQNQTPHHAYEHRGAEPSSSKIHTPHPTLPSQQSIPESILASQTQSSPYPPYGTQDGPSDESWRPESQRDIEQRLRGRPRSGPGSRGGRVRKSMPAQGHQLGTPEWEREDWAGVTESQAGPDGYYNHATRSGRGITRRGSGGGGRGGYAQGDRAASMGSQRVSPGFTMGSPNDPYAHTKKTRTKPIRNADGVLIRKDGRPDMRSQSSAANLRKVHARKEGEASVQGSPTGFTPSTLHHSTSADAPDTPSPSGYAHPDPDVRQKHNAIMGKMFPDGVDNSRKQHDYAHQVFEEDRDHTAHPHNRHHRTGSSSANKIAIKIKRETSEQNKGAQSPNDGDIDMDRADDTDHASEEEHSPASRGPGQSQDLAETQASESQSESTVPETQAADAQSSMTLSA